MKALINCIFISFATLESLIIICLGTTNSVAYCDGYVWVFPIILISKPIYELIRYMLSVNEDE